MKTIKLFGIVLFLGVLLLALVSSQTLIAGKIYNSDFSDTLSNVDVKVICNNGAPIVTQSFDDGTYVVRFEESECSGDDSVSVSGSKSGFIEKSGTGTVSKCEGADCTDNYVMIINLGIKTQPAQTGSSSSSSSGGGGTMRYYSCGNGKCDSGESINTCSRDCKKVQTTIQNKTTSIGEVVQLSEAKTENPSETLEVVSENLTETSGLELPEGNNSVMGTLGVAGIIVVVVFFVVLIASSITVRLVRSRNRDY